MPCSVPSYSLNRSTNHLIELFVQFSQLQALLIFLVATKTCQRPSQTLPDGHVVGHMKSYYSVGENVTYVCDVDGNETRIITCSSEGTWTSLAYVCGGQYNFNIVVETPL